VVDRRLGRIALRCGAAYVSAALDGSITLREGKPNAAETFQWIETFTGELTRMSVTTHRRLSADPPAA